MTKTTDGQTSQSPAPVVDPVSQHIRRNRLFHDIDRLFAEVLAANGGGDSKAQLKQDVFALALSGFRRGGYFVEFGATDGVDLSNSHLLETSYGWTGILAEPGRNWHERLLANRSCHIDTACVWRETGATLTFHEATEGEYSTLSDFAESDYHAHRREDATRYEVDTISLADLLAKYDAPTHIDLLSVDTEGSEFEILQNFDFGQYSFGLITVEHNFSKTRPRLRQLMERNGYELAFENLSKWDDWYIPARPAG